MRKVQTICRNVILLSESLQTDIELENEELQTTYDNIILLSEIVLTDMEIENEAVTDNL